MHTSRPRGRVSSERRSVAVRRRGVATPARPRLRCAAPGGADGAGHAGDVRDRRQGDRQPDPRDIRRLRLVRDAAARRLLRARSRTGCWLRAALGVACAVLICLGTLASRTTWLAALAMAVVGFAVLFAGVVSSVLAGATTSLLLAFILPVSLPGPVCLDPRSGRRLGAGGYRLDPGDRDAVAVAGAQSDPGRGDRRLPGARRSVSAPRSPG